MRLLNIAHLEDVVSLGIDVSYYDKTKEAIYINIILKSPPEFDKQVRLPKWSGYIGMSPDSLNFVSVSATIAEDIRKCKNFLETLLRLSSQQPPETYGNVKKLIQGLLVSKSVSTASKV